ncbi:MAG: hypothetical protein Q9181_007319 [Wetmoreana brouardii]
MRDAVSTARFVFGRGPLAEPDIEQGADVDPYRTRAAVSSGYHQLQAFLDSPENFMLYRRFGALHAHVLRLHEKNSRCLEQELEEFDNIQLREDRRHDFALQDRPRKWLLRQVRLELSAYDSMILSMDSLKRGPEPSNRRYESVKDYLLRGPPVPPDYFDTRNNRWRGYERAVKDLLKEPETAHWLNGPMFGDRNENHAQRWHGRNRNLKRANNTQWVSGARKGLEYIAKGGGILFWISHITAALSFVLITNNSGPKGHPMAGILLGYWYVSAVSIVVRELLAKGYVYARKVLLGGVLACVGGYYTLVKLLNVSAGSAFTATPIFFTIVVLLIRTI